MVFELRSAAYGDKPSNDVARETGFSGRDMGALAALYIPRPRTAHTSRHEPEAGAVCGSSARTDLYGGGR